MRFPKRMPEAMPQKAAFPPAFSASSNPLVLARQARSEALRDWRSALDQKRPALCGGGVAALTACASLLTLANPAAISAWTMAAVFVAALTSSIAGQALMVWPLRRDIAWHGLKPFVVGAAISLPIVLSWP